ncbi:MAG: hypothetical protein LBC68_10985 [Prevotellaceae bacterium]|jgi:hypothetical protein|nr:hypothetical protein [Prevotellaceae bacterium]
MNVLVACEYSGTVRDAFEDAGWDAWSCDLLPTESEQTKESGKHYQGDCLTLIDYVCNKRTWIDFKHLRLPEKWDLLIGHPPCTYLSFAYTGKERYSVGRLQNKIKAYQFFLDLWNAPIEHICLENPIGYIHTGLLPYTQIVEPYYFGDAYKKKTCLWLKNLPKLYCTETGLFGEGTKTEPKKLLINGSRKEKRRLPAMFNAACKERSKFHKGIARAMAEQWTKYIKNKNYEQK